MPELPEVESTRKGLEQLVLGQTIEGVEVRWPRLVRTDLILSEWQALLEDQTIQQVGRRGKYLLFYLSDWVLVSHLRMEGKYLYFSESDVPEIAHKHVHVIFHFTDQSQLHYKDVRKFGRFELVKESELVTYFKDKKIGPEPLSDLFELEEFKQTIRRTRRAVKPALLSQEYVAGLGNIYADEVLYQAYVHPAIKASDLTDQQIEAIYYATIDVMERAIEAGGSSIRTYRNSLGEAGTFQEALKVYGHQGTPCPRCGSDIEKIKLAQRGTHFCPHCQPLELK